MLTKTVDVSEAQKRLMELLSLVSEGSEVILTESNKPFARLVPIASPTGPRVAGLHTGSIWIRDDFDEPLPDDLWMGTP